MEQINLDGKIIQLMMVDVQSYGFNHGDYASDHWSSAWCAKAIPNELYIDVRDANNNPQIVTKVKTRARNINESNYANISQNISKYKIYYSKSDLDDKKTWRMLVIGL